MQCLTFLVQALPPLRRAVCFRLFFGVPFKYNVPRVDVERHQARQQELRQYEAPRPVVPPQPDDRPERVLHRGCRNCIGIQAPNSGESPADLETD